MGNKNGVRKRSKTTISHLRKHDGSVWDSGILKLNMKQLTIHAEELGLRIPRGFCKQQIREQIISFSISSSSDWKRWSKVSKHSDDKYPSTTENGKMQWFPPKAGLALQQTDKYPEKGVRLLKIKEAYPNDNSALSDAKTIDLRKSPNISQKRPLDNLDNSIPALTMALSPIEEFSKPQHNSEDIGNNKKLVCTGKLTPRKIPPTNLAVLAQNQSSLKRYPEPRDEKVLGDDNTNSSIKVPGSPRSGKRKSGKWPTPTSRSRKNCAPRGYNSSPSGRDALTMDTYWQREGGGFRSVAQPNESTWITVPSENKSRRTQKENFDAPQVEGETYV